MEHARHGVVRQRTGVVGLAGVQHGKAHPVPFPGSGRRCSGWPPGPGTPGWRTMSTIRRRKGPRNAGHASGVVSVCMADDHGIQTLAPTAQQGQQHPLGRVGVRPHGRAGVVEQGAVAVRTSTAVPCPTSAARMSKVPATAGAGCTPAPATATAAPGAQPQWQAQHQHHAAQHRQRRQAPGQRGPFDRGHGPARHGAQHPQQQLHRQAAQAHKPGTATPSMARGVTTRSPREWQTGWPPG
jgi:hypothetical protein